MNSSSQSLVDMDRIEKEVETPKKPRKKSRSATNAIDRIEPLDEGLSAPSNIDTSVDTPIVRAGKTDLAEKFREDLVGILSSEIGSIRMSLFMDKADEYPRFVWQDLLLSFQYFQSHCQEQRDMNTLGNALRNFSFIIKSYPDILQRELLRDSFVLESKNRKKKGQLEKEIIKKREELHQQKEQARQSEGEAEQDNSQSVGDEKQHYCELKGEGKQGSIQVQTELEGYGVLHAAVLSRRREFVWLVSNPNIYRNEIFYILIERLKKVSDSFKLIKRAALWRDMQKVSGPSTKVSSFMKNFGKIREASTVEELKKFIEKTKSIDLSDEYHPDPWVVILAWSSVSKRRDHILKAFKEKRPDLYEEMITTLEKRKSPFAQFFTETREGDILPTVERIISLLVHKRPGEGSDRLHTTLLQRSFLDRFTEKTPNSRWSPLHLAAASGDHGIVSILIESCEKLLSAMGDQLPGKAVYIRTVQESFFDAKYMTPLHYAVLGNHRDVVKQLTEWKRFQPYVNARDIFSRTALQMACSQPKRAPIVEYLMKNVQNIDVNAKDCCSFTSLHWAVYALSSEAVKFLTAEGEKRIRVTEKDIHERHPYDMAARAQTRSITNEDTNEIGRSISIRKDIEQQLLSSPALKDEVDRLYRDRQVYVDAANAILVGAALIASVTFGGWLQPPFGDHLGSTDNKVQVFWAFNSLSFFFAIATVMAGATAVVPVDQYIKDSVEGIRRWLIITSFLLILSVACVLGAFAAAGFATLSLVPDLTTNMTVTTSFGSVVSAAIGVVFCYRLLRVHAVWKNMLKDEIEFLKRLTLKIGKKLELRQPSCQSCEFKLCTEDAIRTIENQIYEKKISTFTPKSEALPVNLDAVSLTGVHCDLIREEWRRIHEVRSWETCPIRECYDLLETFCLDEILKFTGVDISHASWTAYNQMWSKLSQVGLFGTNRLTVKKEARNITPQQGLD